MQTQTSRTEPAPAHCKHQSFSIELNSELKVFLLCRHLACEDDQDAVARLLLEHGARLDLQNKVPVRTQMPIVQLIMHPSRLSSIHEAVKWTQQFCSENRTEIYAVFSLIY